MLLEDVDKLGKKGELVTVAAGYWRNYLAPFRKAKAATPDILASVFYRHLDHMIHLFCLVPSKQRKTKKSAALLRHVPLFYHAQTNTLSVQIKNQAKRLAVALKTIGKFIIKKKAGEGDTIFGRSVFDRVRLSAKAVDLVFCSV